MRIIKFTALWCADCIVMRPMWSEIKSKYPEIEIEEYDFDDHTDVAVDYKIKKVPHTIFLDSQGNEITRFEGLKSKQELLDLLDKLSLL